MSTEPTRYGDRTRWLGDAYQAEYKLDPDGPVKRLALVQTPAFVGEFLLDGTLEPALAPAGARVRVGGALDPNGSFVGGGVPLEEFTLIDPTCGCGHLLCQAFDRLFARWREQHPDGDRLWQARKVLSQITGIDLDPLCVEIARLRLIVAACDAAGVLPYDPTRWGLVPRVVWADALLQGDHPMQPYLAVHPSLKPRYGEYRAPQMKASPGVPA